MTCLGTTSLQVHRVGLQMDLHCFNYNLVLAPRCHCCQARWDSPVTPRVTQSINSSYWPTPTSIPSPISVVLIGHSPCNPPITEDQIYFPPSPHHYFKICMKTQFYHYENGSNTFFSNLCQFTILYHVKAQKTVI